MAVFAFDRDWTVDVNPHPRKEAVPLEWIRHLAHETDHPVYAIGNQSLADEAAIPGVVDVVGRHPDDWGDWLGDKRPNGRYEQFPNRRRRLALIADLHPDADQYVVVDDLDLGDVPGWDHYHAWEFVPAVRDGEVDPGLPWCQPRADGGRPAGAGIAPTGVDALRSFVDEHADADAFQLEYAGENGTRNRLVADVSVVERTVRRPAAAITVGCTGLPPGTGEFRVRLDDVQFVSAVDPPDELFAVRGDTPAERAGNVADLAAVAPDRVDIPMVVDLLGSSDRAAREAAVEAAGDLADARPEDCVAVLPALRSALATDAQPTGVLDCIASVAAARPSEIAPFADEVTPYLQASADRQRRAAARALGDVADHDPADVVGAVPALSTLVADREPGFEHALFALNSIAAEYPSEVRPAASVLGDVLADSSLDAGPRLNASAALGRTASEFPDTGVDAVESLVDLLDADDQRLRANAAGALSDVATVHAGALVPHVADLAVLLESDDDYALVNTTAALSRVAESAPDAVEPFTERYVSLLDHDHELVRLNACWALGHLGASDAASRLEAVRTADDDEEVRKRAAWALSEIANAQ